MVRGIAAAAVLASFACATSKPRPRAAPAVRPAPMVTQAAQQDRDSLLICQVETPTGSHIPEKVCRPLNEVEWDRLRTQEFLLAPRSRPATH